MTAPVLQLEHSVEINVSPAFVWKYRTNIANWNDPPAIFVLDGPFAAGTRGRTHMPDQAPWHWLIREVQPEELFVLEMQLDGAMLSFEWRFEALSQTRTKMTQRVLLSGENAAVYAAEVEQGFGPTLAPGMKRIAAEMAAAALKSTDGR